MRATVDALIGRVGHPEEAAMREAQQRLDRLTKPPGSLGRLEELAVRLAGITGRVRQRLPNKTVVLMAADHGVAEEGVSAYPQSVTAQMVANFLRGRRGHQRPGAAGQRAGGGGGHGRCR